jgi:hypothetical protein
MYPADGALGAVLLPGLDRFAVTIRLEYLLGAERDAQVTGFTPAKIDLQRIGAL